MSDDPTRLCICCQRTQLDTSQLQTCHQCVGQTRRWLTGITQLHAWLPLLIDGYPRRHTSGVSDQTRHGAETPLVGGDALALLAYGGDGVNAPAGSRHVEDDSPSVLWELERWEADWRETQHLAAATTKATVTNTSGYLLANLTWASQHHPAFNEFHHDLRKLHATMRRVTGTEDRPVRTTTPCLHCDRMLERRWDDNGLSDDAWCPSCHRRYDQQQFLEARKAMFGQTEVGA